MTVLDRESNPPVGMHKFDALWFRIGNAQGSSIATVISIEKGIKLHGFVCKVRKPKRGVDLVSKEPHNLC